MLLPQSSILCLRFVPVPLKWQRWHYQSTPEVFLCRISVFVGCRGVTGRRQGLFWMCLSGVQHFSHSFAFFFPGEEGTQTHTESGSQEAEGQTRCQSCTSTFLKLIWRFLIILSVSSSWVGTTQFVKITYETFDCPFFMTWFSTNWNIMVFPIYYSGHLATAQEKQSPIKKFR